MLHPADIYIPWAIGMPGPSYPKAFAMVNSFCARPFRVGFDNSRGMVDSTDTTLKTLEGLAQVVDFIVTRGMLGPDAAAGG